MSESKQGYLQPLVILKARSYNCKMIYCLGQALLETYQCNEHLTAIDQFTHTPVSVISRSIISFRLDFFNSL